MAAMVWWPQSRTSPYSPDFAPFETFDEGATIASAAHRLLRAYEFLSDVLVGEEVGGEALPRRRQRKSHIVTRVDQCTAKLVEMVRKGGIEKCLDRGVMLRTVPDIPRQFGDFTRNET